MNVAQERPRTWSPHIILFSIVLHAVVIYYIASAFNIVPKILPTPTDPPTIRTVTLLPPQPIIDEIDPIKRQPLFKQRQPEVPPIQVPVDRTPLTPTFDAAPTTGPRTVIVGQPVPEEPVARNLPPYPVAAIRDEKEGRVVLSITIMPDGSVRDIQVVSARPRSYFEDSAIKSVRTWRYAPSNVIRTNVIVHMDFVLRG